jgi:hypothetical protein
MTKRNNDERILELLQFADNTNINTLSGSSLWQLRRRLINNLDFDLSNDLREINESYYTHPEQVKAYMQIDIYDPTNEKLQKDFRTKLLKDYLISLQIGFQKFISIYFQPYLKQTYSKSSGKIYIEKFNDKVIRRNIYLLDGDKEIKFNDFLPKKMGDSRKKNLFKPIKRFKEKIKSFTVGSEAVKTKDIGMEQMCRLLTLPVAVYRFYRCADPDCKKWEINHWKKRKHWFCPTHLKKHCDSAYRKTPEGVKKRNEAVIRHRDKKKKALEENPPLTIPQNV